MLRELQDAMGWNRAVVSFTNRVLHTSKFRAMFLLLSSLMPLLGPSKNSGKETASTTKTSTKEHKRGKRKFHVFELNKFNCKFMQSSFAGLSHEVNYYLILIMLATSSSIPREGMEI